MTREQLLASWALVWTDKAWPSAAGLLGQFHRAPTAPGTRTNGLHQSVPLRLGWLMLSSDATGTWDTLPQRKMAEWATPREWSWHALSHIITRSKPMPDFAAPPRRCDHPVATLAVRCPR